ncbi:hypothetical protein ACFL6S_11235 [Candidatus Poribacteria bacterium]
MKISRSNAFIYTVVALAVIASVVIVMRSAMTRGKRASLGKAFEYDLDELRKTDPSLIKYEESGKIKAGFTEVSAIAVDSEDRIYIAGDRSIRIFNSNGNTLSKMELSDAPQCLTVTDDGTVYVGMRDHVEVYDPSGVRKARWESAGEKAVLTSIAVSGNDVFVANAGGRVVLRYDGSGELVGRIGERDQERNIPGIVIVGPYFDLAVADDGLLRVGNAGSQRMEAYTFDGDLELSWGKASNLIDGFAGCHNPVNFAFLPDGRLVTCEIGLPRVKIYSASGDFESVVAGAELFPKSEEPLILEGKSDFRNRGLDVAVDSQERILVLDPSERAVRIFILKEAKS